jgi:ubiquitin fusion degradation protein 1
MSRTKISHSGVIDFSAPEGVGVCPTWILTNIGVSDNEFFTVRMVHLPKGHYLKLKPKQSDFFKLAQPKEMFE